MAASGCYKVVADGKLAKTTESCTLILQRLTMQGRRKHFRIGQAMKYFSLALLANVLSTIITCKASLWLADASWFLKLMVASFQFLKPLLVKARLPLCFDPSFWTLVQRHT